MYLITMPCLAWLKMMFYTSTYIFELAHYCMFSKLHLSQKESKYPISNYTLLDTVAINVSLNVIVWNTCV